MHLDLEDGGLACQIFLVVLGEGHVDILLVAGAHAHELGLEAGDEAVAAQLEIIVFGLAAFKGDAVHKALKIDLHRVAVLCRTIHRGDSGDLVGLAIHFGLHFLIGDGSFLLGDLQPFILAKSDLGIKRRLNGHLHRLVVLHVHGGHGGLTHGLPSLIQNSLLINVGEDLIDSVFIEDFCAVHGLDHLSGRFALAEAGKRDVLAVFQIGLVQTLFKLCAVDLHDNFRAAVLSGCAFHVHVVFLLYGDGRMAAVHLLRNLIYSIRNSTKCKCYFPQFRTIF